MSQQPFHFIVKHGEKYYLTHDHWEFDPARRHELTKEQQDSLDSVVKLHGEGESAGKAAKVSSVSAAAFTSLDPGPSH